MEHFVLGYNRVNFEVTCNIEGQNEPVCLPRSLKGHLGQKYCPNTQTHIGPFVVFDYRPTKLVCKYVTAHGELRRVVVLVVVGHCPFRLVTLQRFHLTSGY